MSETKKSKKALVLKIIGGLLLAIVLAFVYVVININTAKYSNHPTQEELNKINDINNQHQY